MTLISNFPQVVVRVQNGGGVMETSWTPLDGTTLCDNKWHKIVVSKVETMVSLQVDTNPPSKVKKGKQTVANVNDKFFLGGIPGLFLKNIYIYTYTHIF